VIGNSIAPISSDERRNVNFAYATNSSETISNLLAFYLPITLAC